METETIHREPYIYLGEVTETSALIAWGDFEFRVRKLEAGQFQMINLTRGNIGEPLVNQPAFAVLDCKPTRGLVRFALLFTAGLEDS